MAGGKGSPRRPPGRHGRATRLPLAPRTPSRPPGSLPRQAWRPSPGRQVLSRGLTMAGEGLLARDGTLPPGQGPRPPGHAWPGNAGTAVRRKRQKAEFCRRIGYIVPRPKAWAPLFPRTAPEARGGRPRGQGRGQSVRLHDP